MASNNYYFFTDTDLLLAQTTGAYGPIPKATPTDPDEYRVTSLHTASTNPTAYAACDAIVCVQRIPATTPALVNIILKPLVQPSLNFARIKYIVYKGILESSLISGTDVAAASNNDLTKAIWDTQTRKNASAGTPGATAPAEALGVGLIASATPLPNDPFVDTQPIDNLFYRTGVSFQLPLVKGGWSLGQFHKAGFGIEVLMDGLAFRHPLSLGRQIESIVSVASLTGSETEAQQFDHWHAKEQILGFMDPCAFYGSFFRAGVQAKTSGSVPFVTKTGNELYLSVLSQFTNRNTAYLDIRNEYNYSLNYFKNYQASTPASSTTNVVVGNTTVDYYVSRWPLLTLTATYFAAGNTTTERDGFSLQLPVGDNFRPLVYVSQGYRDINAKANEFPQELKSAERFFADFDAPVGGHTVTKSTSGQSSLTFVVPNVTGQSATTPVSCYIRLKYLKQQQGGTVSTVIQSANYLDNLVWPLDLGILLNGTALVNSAVYDEEVYVNAQGVPGLNCDFIGSVGIARDADNTYFIVAPVIVRNDDGQAAEQVSVSGETADDPGGYPAVLVSKYADMRVRKAEITLPGTGGVSVADFVFDADTAAQSRFGAPQFDKLLIITVANAAYESWKTKVEAAGAVLDKRFRIYLGIANLVRGTDLGGTGYLSFELVLRGFAPDATTGGYKISEMNTTP